MLFKHSVASIGLKTKFHSVTLMFHRYKYETSVSHNNDDNSTEGILPCLANPSLADAHQSELTRTGTA